MHMQRTGSERPMCVCVCTVILESVNALPDVKCAIMLCAFHSGLKIGVM